jgi:hypothetical protein
MHKMGKSLWIFPSNFNVLLVILVSSSKSIRMELANV